MLTTLCLQKLKALQAGLENNKSSAFCHDLLTTISDYLTIQNNEETLSLQSRIISLLIKQTHEIKPADLFHAMHNDILNYSSDYVGILDTHSKFISLNDHYTQVIGYSDTNQALGLSYEHFKSSASEQAELFKSQDLSVLTTQEPLVFLSYHRYWNGTWRLLHGEKTCIKDEKNHSVGVFSRAKDITHSGLVDISRFLMRDQEQYFNKISRHPFTYYISQETDRFSLSRKERDVLFYFIRGKTAQDIADLLSRSKRTIDMHLESIKIKFNVTSKPHLIEKAIFEGYMTIIPESLLEKNSF